MIGLKKKIHLTVIYCLVLSFLPLKNFSQERKISEDELIDKISGFWIGQLTGNYLGLPFERTFWVAHKRFDLIQSDLSAILT